MPKLSDHEIDYLLSDGALSGEEVERIRTGLVAAARARARTRRSWLAMSGAVAAVATALVVLPRGGPDRDALRTKGAGRPAQGPATTLHVACVGGALPNCPRGAVLGFAVTTTAPSGFVTAFADPVGAASERIWYFSDQPLQPGPAPSTTAASDSRVLAKGARIGAEHQARRYRIHVLFSQRPLGRDRAAAARPDPDVIAQDAFDLELSP